MGISCYCWCLAANGSERVLIITSVRAVRLERCSCWSGGCVCWSNTLSVMNYLEQFKFVMCVISGMLSLFFPIRDFMYAMLIVFGVNYIFGLVAGLKHGEEWNLKSHGIFFIIVVCTCSVASIFITGYFLHAGEETPGVVEALCGVAIWFYPTNIVRKLANELTRIPTMWKVVGFCLLRSDTEAIDKCRSLALSSKSSHECR